MHRYAALQKAQELERHAASIEEAELRERFLELAREWRELAEAGRGPLQSGRFGPVPSDAQLS